MTWQEHYGFKTGPFSGILQDAGGNRVDTRQESIGIDEKTGESVNYGIGFGPGDLRKARREGWTAMSILEYIKGPGGRGTHEGSQYYADTGGRAAATPQAVINELRQDEATQRAFETGYGKYNTLQTNYDTLSNTISNLPDYSNQIEDLTNQQSANSLSIAANQAAANNAMAEAQKVRTPFAVTGNSAMQIQGVPSSNQLAGQISAGLGGLSRGNRRFQNTSVNI